MPQSNKIKPHLGLGRLLSYFLSFSMIVGAFAILYDTVLDRYTTLELEKQLCQAQEVLDHQQQEQQRLAHRIDLLRSESLDRDLLEERVRVMLNYSHHAERIILLSPSLPPSEDNTSDDVPEHEGLSLIWALLYRGHVCSVA